VYLDTSVPSAFFDTRWPHRLHITRLIFSEAAVEYRLALSEVTLAELESTPDPIRRREMLKLVSEFPVYPLAQISRRLSLSFVRFNLVPASKVEDAQHLAIAVEYGFDFMVSWNFSHMVTAKTQKRLPIVSAQQGYFKQLPIVSPEAFTGRSLP